MVNEPIFLRHRRRLVGLTVALLLAPILLAAAGAIAAAPASAADAAGNFRVFGSGDLPCGRWLDDRGAGNASAKQSEMWVAGYLSAVNEFVYKGPDITQPHEGAYLLEWLDGYCRKHPSHALAVAAHELLLMLRRRQ
jgi:hypothetical protein